MININQLPFPVLNNTVTEDDLHVTKTDLNLYYVRLDIQVGDKVHQCHWSNDQKCTHYRHGKLMWNSDEATIPDYQNNSALNEIFLSSELYDDWQTLADQCNKECEGNHFNSQNVAQIHAVLMQASDLIVRLHNSNKLAE